jgi:hypothetical protein
MATIALMGPPGSGKTTMACLTAPPPVHVIDIDRKVKSMAAFRPGLENGSITSHDIGETLTEDSMIARLNALVKDEKMARPPRGWTNFANYCGELEKNEEARKAKTIVIDSYTQLAMHMKAHIQFLRGKSKFVWDDWSTWKSMWTEVTTILVDYALSNDKHLVITLHERVSEKPGQQTGKVMVTTGAKGEKSREYIGTMDVRIAGSIEGAFGLEFGSYFTDVYGLRVEAERDKPPKWVCRVKPDNQRDLRCSFNVGEAVEFEPDFRKIWGKEWR